MKKFFFVCLTIFFVITSGGCWFSRDWVCTCTTHWTDGSFPDEKDSYPIFGSKKKNAEALCENYSEETGVYTTTCELE